MTTRTIKKTPAPPEVKTVEWISWYKTTSRRHKWIREYLKNNEPQRIHINNEFIYKIIVPSEFWCLSCGSREYWRMTFEPDIWRCSVCDPIETAVRIVEIPKHHISLPIKGECHICHGTLFWWRRDGATGDWLCWRCHPGPDSAATIKIGSK